MADDKRGREKQARREERRQRRRAVLEELERGDETEPPVDPETLDGLERDLAGMEFPATGEAVVAAMGDHEVQSARATYTVSELVPDVATEVFNTPSAVRQRVARPGIAAPMSRIVEASQTLPDAGLPWSQRKAYEKTLRALMAIDADDDESVTVMADWIVERIRETERLPGSRGVRRQAAKLCRSNGYEIRDDEWLGV